MSARISDKEKPAREGNPCGPGATFETWEGIMEHQTRYGKFVSRKLAMVSRQGIVGDLSGYSLKPHQNDGRRAEGQLFQAACSQR